MNTSIRNLNRKLSNEGTSFKTLLMEIRRELAEQYINDSTLTLTEISFLLGFSEISSFSRAYRRWEGQSPSEARKSRQ
jgi:AraC-like DNA-binding protein